jgi:beta-galactosidase
VAFYYRARLAAEPVLHVAARDWPRRAGSRPDDARDSFLVYSNLDAVELWQGTASLGSKPIVNGAARWELALRPGANRLIARGRSGARALEDSCDVFYEDRGAACSAQAPAHFTLAMNASNRQYLDSTGTAWEACREYAAGSWGRVGGRLAATRHRIFGTSDDALFQSALEGVEELRFDVPDGRYEIELRFAETQERRPGERAFDVAVNGAPLVTGLDPARDGPYTAITRTSTIECTGGRGIRVTFHAVRGETTVSAVRLTR